jgi:hypothetical protein
MKLSTSRNEPHTVPCGICGTATFMTGTKRCDSCWELESRIQSNPERAYLIATRILGSARSEKAPIPPQMPPKPMPYPTKEEIALYRDTFRRELDKRMDTKHPSASPSTESHEIALRQFVENRNAP